MTTPIVQSISDEQLAELADGCIDSIPRPISALYELAERLIAAEADAKRYRWLRDKDQFDPQSQDEMLAEAFQKYTGNLLDSSIDRAMERTP